MILHRLSPIVVPLLALAWIDAANAGEPAFATSATTASAEGEDGDAAIEEEAGVAEAEEGEEEGPGEEAGAGEGEEGFEEEAEEPEVEGVHLWGGLTFELGGYYRLRGVFIRDLHMFQKNPTSTKPKLKMRGDVDFFVQRLRLEPVLAFGKLAKLEVWIHALDGVIWGDNAGLSDTGVFAGNPSATARDGSEISTITIPAVWAELNVLVGVIRAGRMPSDWGLGLLTDGGGGFDDDFGWNDQMSISDRVLFATMPVAIVQTIAKSEKEPFPLYLALAYDKLVTDDVSIGGARIPYNSNWLSDYSDDVDEFTAALAYDGEGFQWVGAEDSLSVGLYYVTRWQHATRSRAHIMDGFFKLRLGPFFAEAEAYFIVGATQALSLRPPVDPDENDWLRMKANVEISSWIARLGVDIMDFRVKLESGYASGDEDPTNENFKARSANPNVRVGLVLYPIVLAEITKARWADNPGMWSEGGVYDSWFFMQSIRYEPLKGLEIIVGFLEAWRDCVDGATISRDRTNAFLGFETDIAVKYHFAGDHAHLGIEGGVLHVGKALKDPMLNMPDDTWTVQVWTAFTP